jgi:hypothetical protein
VSGQFEPSELRDMYATVELGLDVELFLKSSVGQYLLRKAE